MTEVVLDASALIAFLRREPGGERVDAVLGRCLMSSVNLAEVVAKAIDRGGSLEAVSASLEQLPIRTVPFSPEEAMISGSLRAATRHRGLSLGDRCCLALALNLGMPVLTTESQWRDLDIGISIELIR